MKSIYKGTETLAARACDLKVSLLAGILATIVTVIHSQSPQSSLFRNSLIGDCWYRSGVKRDN